MDWEANLAAVIKCTDANLEQQFRQFADIAGDLTTYRGSGGGTSAQSSSVSYGHQYTAAASGGGASAFGFPSSLFDNIARSGSNGVDNIGTAYFRDTMTSQQRHNDGVFEHPTMSSNPNRSKRPSGGDRGAAAAADSWSPSTRGAGLPVSFADDFRKRQERKRSGEASPTMHKRYTSRGTERFESDSGDQESQHPEFDEEIDSHNNNNSGSGRSFARRTPRAGGMHGVAYQMYSSPTYDVAQMMEQVRLSLKLEVDARAAIAERQLSALLSLCKTSTEEIDRLRVEVCANDRQIHTLEQVQSKLRQELTTQKDIGFHLQSMCGKDESWRMQAENQLLELRQMVAAIREQGNSLHAAAQEKLSRAELLVQFNAAMEPIKAQFQANLQHQAQQIAEVTRTTSSSSLLLDALTQRVNRGLADEVSDLRNDLQALKSHVSKMNAVLDTSRSAQEQTQAQAPVVQQPPPPPAVDPVREAEKARFKAKQRSDMVEDVQAQVLCALQEKLDSIVRDVESTIERRVSQLAATIDDRCAQEHKKIHAAWDERTGSLTKSCADQIETLQQQAQRSAHSAARDAQDVAERLKQQVMTAATALVEATASASQNRQLELLRMVESEQKERKRALEELQESCRKSRHALEDQVHAVAHEGRSSAAHVAGKIETRVRELEKQSASALQSMERDALARIESVTSALKTQSDAAMSKADAKLSAVEESVAKLERMMTSLSTSVAALSAAAKDAAIESKAPPKRPEAAHTNTDASAYVTAMDAMLQKMQLQLQLQAQVAQMHPPYWIASPHSAAVMPAAGLTLAQTPGPPVPTLALPPVHHASAAPLVSSTPSEPLSAPTALTQEANGSTSNERSDRVSSDNSRAPVAAAAASGGEVSLGGATAAASIAHVSPPDDLTPATPETMSKEPTSASRPPIATPTLAPALPPTQPSAALDPTEKIQQTIAATAKGALAEAEMAKLRVESRRQQQLQAQTQLESAPASSSMSSATTPRSIPPSPRSAPVPPVSSQLPIASPAQGTTSATAAPAPPHPPLTRAASASSLSLSSGHQEGANSTGVTASSTATLPSARLRSNSIAVGSANAPAPRPSVQVPQPPPQQQQQPPNVSTTNSVSAHSTPALPSGTSIMAPNSASKPPPPPPLSHPASRPVVSSGEAKTTAPTSTAGVNPSPRSTPPPPVPPSPSSSTSAASPATLASASSSSLPPTPRAQAAADAIRPTPLVASTPATPTAESATSSSTDAKPSAPISKPLPASPMAASAKPAPPVGSSASHVLCTLCRLPIRIDERAEHETSQCSKRTEACSHCHSRVLWSDLQAHERTCATSSAATSALDAPAEHVSSSSNEAVNLAANSAVAVTIKKCRHCNGDVASQDLFDHELRCDKMLKQCPHCLRRQKVSLRVCGYANATAPSIMSECVESD